MKSKTWQEFFGPFRENKKLRYVCLQLVDRGRSLVKDYGSDNWLLWQSSEFGDGWLMETAENICRETWGKTLPELFGNICVTAIAMGYSQARKGNYETLKNGTSLIEDSLFDDALRAFYAIAVTVDGRKRLKLGSTQDDLMKYLERTYRGFNYVLLARGFKTKKQEQESKDLFVRYRDPQGHEYYLPAAEIKEWIQTNLTPEPGFDAIWRTYGL